MSDVLLEKVKPENYSDKVFVVEDGEYILKATDRCDRCAAQAFVQVMLSNGNLLFCGHHYKLVEVRLLPQALSVRDERKRLIEKPVYKDE